MQNEIYIFGAGGLGRETYCITKALPYYKAIAFVESDNCTQRECVAAGAVVPIITESEFEARCAKKRVSAVIGIGNPKIRKAIANKFESKCDWPNIIHPSIIETGVVKYGIGNLITVNCTLSDNIEIGNFNLFNSFISVGHDSIVGDYNVIMPAVNISGNIVIGDCNMLGAKVFLLQGISIGDCNTVGAGSVVLRKVGNDTNLFGVPAKKIEL